MKIEEAKQFFPVERYDDELWLGDITKESFDLFLDSIYESHRLELKQKEINLQFKDSIIKRQKEKVNLARKILAKIFWMTKAYKRIFLTTDSNYDQGKYEAGVEIFGAIKKMIKG